MARVTLNDFLSALSDLIEDIRIEASDPDSPGKLGLSTGAKKELYENALVAIKEMTDYARSTIPREIEVPTEQSTQSMGSF